MTKSPSTARPSQFRGKIGARRLVEAVRVQTLVSGEREIAVALCKKGTIRIFAKHGHLMVQGSPENDIHLILSGEVAIVVNGRTVATRVAGTHVGEMALVDVLAKRSATVVATEETVTLSLPEHSFANISAKHPDLWRRIAVEISKRLRERNKGLREPNNQPVVFLGSSTEGLPLAEALRNRLLKEPFVPKLWSDGVFETSRTTIENLVKLSQEIDFAVLVLSHDDFTASRGPARPSPRDNVIFELGLMMGALGRERVLIVKPVGTDIKIPSDLLGVTCLEYSNAKKRSATKRLQTASSRLVKHIKDNGPR